MRRAIAIGPALIIAIAMLPLAVRAAPVTKVVERATEISCELPIEDGIVTVYAVSSSLFGTFGDLAIWPAGSVPFEDEPVIVASDATVRADASRVTASFDLATYDPESDPPFGESVGRATLTASLVPDGAVVPVRDRFRAGNTWQWVIGTIQPMLVDGTLSLAGERIDDLGRCVASAARLTYRSTNPSAYVERFQATLVGCEWPDGDRLVSLDMAAGRSGAVGEIIVETEDRTVGGYGDAVLRRAALSLRVAIGDYDTGEVLGAATANATLDSTGLTQRTRERSVRTSTELTTEILSVRGTLAVTIDGITDSLPIDDAHCYAARERYVFTAVRPAGPKPRALANDAPSGAIALSLGKAVRVVTGANDPDPEVSCVLRPPFGEDEAPITYTAWWTVRGTGATMTADTTGSDFDTIVGVYRRTSAGWRQVACVDDLFEPAYALQARATWASRAGTTYYIQVGGYDGSTGRIRLVAR